MLGVVNAKEPATLPTPPLKVELANVNPLQISPAVGTVVIVGVALFTVTVNAVLVLLQVDVEFLTEIFPVYIPTLVEAGTAIVIEFAVIVELVTVAKLFVGLAFQVILYWSGVAVVAL